MPKKCWKTDIELINEAYYQRLVEEGLIDYFKGFSRKLFKRAENKVEEFDDDVFMDQLDDQLKKLTDRLKEEGPDAVKKFLNIVKQEADVEFKDAIESNSNKIFKSLRYGVDVAADGVANFIYNFIEAVRDGSARGTERPFTSSLNKTEEDAERVDKGSPRSILMNIENIAKEASLNKSFGFNSEVTIMVADKLAELSNELSSLAQSRGDLD